MATAKMPNPYDHRHPVRRPGMFAGRALELAAIAAELDQIGPEQPAGYIAIHGRRAAGKTSLLNRTEAMARERGMLPVRVDLVPGDATAPAFVRKLYEEITVAVAADGAGISEETAVEVRRVLAGKTPPADFALQFPEACALRGGDGSIPEVALRHDLQLFVRKSGRPLVILVDEAQLIAGDGDILSLLRTLGNRLNGALFVLAGTADLIRRITEVFSPLLRQFVEIELTRFVEYEDVADCMLRPLLEVGLGQGAFADFHATVMDVQRLTDGNPYEIQLYCHEMFARQQAGSDPAMSLSLPMFESVLSRLEAGRDVLERPLIQAVRSMSDDELLSFNILCSALGHATAEEVWLAYRVIGNSDITWEFLAAHRDRLVADGVLRDQSVIQLVEGAELFDETYIRLWIVNKVTQKHRQIMGRRNFEELLSRRLTCLLSELVEMPGGILKTCCLGMDSSHLNAALDAFDLMCVDSGGAMPFAVDFVHAALLDSGMPGALDLSAVTCTFGDASAVRWAYSADSADVDLSAHAVFAAAAARVAELGGALTVERTRQPVKPWDRMTAWLRSSEPPLRDRFADNHLRASMAAYGAGKTDAAREHLSFSFELRPTWAVANNSAYLCLAEGDFDGVATWADRTLGLATSARQRALTQYNAAVAALKSGDADLARERFRATRAECEHAGASESVAEFLYVPRIRDGELVVEEEKGIQLGEATESACLLLGVDTSPDTGEVDAAALQAVVPGEPKAPVVLAVATEWSSAFGGLSTLNRNLCQAFAGAGAVVYCVVLTATEQEMAEARGAGVELLASARIPGAEPSTQLTRRPRMPDGVVPDLVVGHSRITGPAAHALVGDFFPDAKRLHFVHMAPDEIEWHKTDRLDEAAQRAEERTDVERSLGETAHRVVAVGPRLHSRFLNELQDVLVPPLRLDPGFDTGDCVPRTPPEGLPLKVLLVGRTEDARIKGVDLAARACATVASWRRRAGLDRISLFVRGAPVDGADEQRAQIAEWADNPDLEVIVRTYATQQDRLTADIRRASLVVMPSRSEGFGLVGLEAITHGVPTLVSASSGLAELLTEVLDREVVGRVVVPMSGYDEEDAESWARAIDATLRDRTAAFRRAAELRAVLAERVTWKAAAELLLEEARETAGH